MLHSAHTKYHIKKELISIKVSNIHVHYITYKVHYLLFINTGFIALK